VNRSALAIGRPGFYDPSVPAFAIAAAPAPHKTMSRRASRRVVRTEGPEETGMPHGHMARATAVRPRRRYAA